MKLFKVIALVCFAIAVTKATSVPQSHNNAVTDFLQNDQLPLGIKESVKVKRRIYEENNDRQLKQISLSSLIGDFEKGLFASASSVNKVLTDKNVNIPEIKPSEHDVQHEVNKRNIVTEEEAENAKSTTEAALTETVTSAVPVTNKVLLQTTEKVPEINGKPAHIVIDRIAIQPHTGGVAFIPIFDLKRNVNGDEQAKDHELTKITISKTEITGLSNLATIKAEEISSSATTEVTTESNESTLSSETTTDVTTLETTTIADSSSTTSSSSTTTSSTPSISSSSTEAVVLEVSTTPKNIEQLKEAEEELKEKVAEIEADPVILSARV